MFYVPMGQYRHLQLGGPNEALRQMNMCNNCKGNPLRFRRPLVFRFRFQLPPAFRSRHLVSLP